ncbi:MAG: hypothetical protein LC792_05485, partial [Actinobacteria bacterium]|nr:hypothetical protein [Actinomycetota bacterium]
VRQILDEVGGGPWDVVGDLPAGPMAALAGLADYADTVVVVVEPTATSLLTSRRLARLGAGGHPRRRMVALATKVREPADVDLVRRRTGLEVVGAVPWDLEVEAAGRMGRAPIDHAPRSPAVQALEALVDRLAAGRE